MRYSNINQEQLYLHIYTVVSNRQRLLDSQCSMKNMISSFILSVRSELNYLHSEYQNVNEEFNAISHVSYLKQKTKSRVTLSVPRNE